jgi:hypothetical protein
MEELSLNLRLLQISGIVEPPTVSGSTWRKFLFSLYMGTSVLVFTPILFGELLALYHFWGDLVVITNNVFTLVGNITFYGEALYMIIRRREFLMLLKRLQDMTQHTHRWFIYLLTPWRTIPTERPPLVGEVPTYADRGCHVVSVTDPYGCILEFLDRTYCVNPIDNTYYAPITTTPSTGTKHFTRTLAQSTSLEHSHKALH